MRTCPAGSDLHRSCAGLIGLAAVPREPQVADAAWTGGEGKEKLEVASSLPWNEGDRGRDRDIKATLEHEDQTKRSASPLDMFWDKVERR